MSRNPTAPPPPKVLTLETTTAQPGKELAEAGLLARYRAAARRTASTANICGVYVMSGWPRRPKEALSDSG